MNDRIQQRFTQRRLGHRQGFDSLDTAIADRRFQVLCAQQIHRLAHLRKQVAVAFVLVEQVVVRAEIADLHIRAGDELFRRGMERQYRCPFQMLAIAQMQLFDQTGGGLLQVCGVHALTLRGAVAECGYSGFRKAAHRRIGYRHTVPSATLFAQKKFVERCAF